MASPGPGALPLDNIISITLPAANQGDTMTIQDLGAIGELIGGAAVIATLIYLAVQLKQNTQSLEASRLLALAQTYQMRSDALQAMLVQASDSDHIGPIIIKLTSRGYPEDIESLDVLTEEERGRFRQWHIAQITHWDNMHYQYQQGFLDEEYFDDVFHPRVERLAPVWRALKVTAGRRSFEKVLESLGRE